MIIPGVRTSESFEMISLNREAFRWRACAHIILKFN